MFSCLLRLTKKDIDDVVHLTSVNAPRTRLFCVGVGDRVSRHAIHTLGRTGGGVGFFVGESESPLEIQKKMAKLVNQSVQTVLTNVRYFLFLIFSSPVTLFIFLPRKHSSFAILSLLFVYHFLVVFLRYLSYFLSVINPYLPNKLEIILRSRYKSTGM